MEDCSICLDQINEKRFLECGHKFHPKCINQWLSNHHSCPLCRHSPKIVITSVNFSRTASFQPNLSDRRQIYPICQPVGEIEYIDFPCFPLHTLIKKNHRQIGKRVFIETTNGTFLFGYHQNGNNQNWNDWNVGETSYDLVEVIPRFIELQTVARKDNPQTPEYLSIQIRIICANGDNYDFEIFNRDSESHLAFFRFKDIYREWQI